MLSRIVLTLILFAAAGPAAAHPGHFGELAGHSHWVAGAALGLAGIIALWAATRNRRGKNKPKAQPDENPEETSKT